mmetsp:Transcript_26386/g.83567  ORF Transcript_26386/g.83567 Transcript_26386/m.83567 type:complete len:357 (+) Transcript_26386:21-1091(+)
MMPAGAADTSRACNSGQDSASAGARSRRPPSLVPGRPALQEVLGRAHEALEGGAVHREQADLRGSHDRGGAGLVLEERELPEVVPSLVRHRELLPVVRLLRRHQLALVDDVEEVPTVALGDDLGTFGVLLHLEGVDDSVHLAVRHRLEQRHLPEHSTALAPLPLHGFHDDVVEGLAVQLPHRRGLTADNARGAGAVVEEGQLAKEVALRAHLHHLLLAVDDLHAVEDAIRDDVEVVAGVSLADDPLARSEADRALHRQDDVLHVLGLQGCEQEGGRQDRRELGHLLRRLGVHRRVELGSLVPVAEGLGGDARAGAEAGGRRYGRVVGALLILLLIRREDRLRGRHGIIRVSAATRA